MNIFIDTQSNIKNFVIDKFKHGFKQTAICKHLNLHKSVVCRFIQRYKRTGNVRSQRPGKCGRKLSISHRVLSKIKRESIKDPTATATAREQQPSVRGECLNVSVRSMRRYLLMAGRLSFRPINCPSLNAKPRQCPIGKTVIGARSPFQMKLP